MPTKLADGLGLRDALLTLPLDYQETIEIRPKIWFLRSSFTLQVDLFIGEALD